MAYILTCDMTFDNETDAQNAYDQLRARAVNTSVQTLGRVGLRLSEAELVKEREDGRVPDEIARWGKDRFGIVRDGRPDTDDPPQWIEPSGAQDAYPLTDIYGNPTRVRHNGKNWQNNTEANIWEPGVSGWDEV